MSKLAVQAHFVTFFSPGTFVAEETSRPIKSWDIETARLMAGKIVERYDAIPYAFQFSTRGRNASDLDSKTIAESPMYFLPHCKVETLEEVEKRNAKDEEILRYNMRTNHYDRIIVTTKGWKLTLPLSDKDVVLK